MSKLTVYLRAKEIHRWEDNYSEEFPYKIYPSLDDSKTKWSWPVGSFEVDVPDLGLTIQEVVEYQLLSLEEVLEKHNAQSTHTRIKMEQAIAELRCLPAPGDIDE